MSSVPGSLERVPASGVVAGTPQGIFFGRSLLTGRAVCLLFLGGGRVTRSIPEGGLEAFDWARHQSEHPGDSGTWTLTGGQLSITWGDGGVHEGPLTVNPAGIEYYGKRYAQPRAATIADLAGTWEAASGFAIAGGDGINRLSILSVKPDGRYRWGETVGGTVGGLAAATGGADSGTLSIAGQTMAFAANDGSIVARTFLPAAGEQLLAFSLDRDLFTRSTS
jgi:hypothetical protein